MAQAQLIRRYQSQISNRNRFSSSSSDSSEDESTTTNSSRRASAKSTTTNRSRRASAKSTTTNSSRRASNANRQQARPSSNQSIASNANRRRAPPSPSQVDVLENDESDSISHQQHVADWVEDVHDNGRCRTKKTINTDHRDAAKEARDSIRNPRRPINKGGYGVFKSTKQKPTNLIPDIEKNRFIQDGICVTNTGMLACKHALKKYKYLPTKILFNKLSINHLATISITYEMLVKSTMCSVKRFVNAVVRRVYDVFATESLFPKNVINFINSYTFAIKNIDECTGNEDILVIIDSIYKFKDFSIREPLTELCTEYEDTSFNKKDLLGMIDYIKQNYIYPFEVYAYVKSSNNNLEDQRRNARLTNWTELEYDKLVESFQSDDDADDGN